MTEKQEKPAASPTAGTWRKGDKAPDKGVPYRHTRDRAQVLLDTATEGQLREALRLLMDKDPRPVLDALAVACDPDRESP